MPFWYSASSLYQNPQDGWWAYFTYRYILKWYYSIIAKNFKMTYTIQRILFGQFMITWVQAKVGNDSFEASLQALRGSNIDVSLEAIEIKVLRFLQDELHFLPVPLIASSNFLLCFQYSTSLRSHLLLYRFCFFFKLFLSWMGFNCLLVNITSIMVEACLTNGNILSLERHGDE